MNQIQTHLSILQVKGWTLVAIADELKCTVNTVEKWKSGKNKPRYRDVIYILLKQLNNKKRIPKKRRYKKPRYILSE